MQLESLLTVDKGKEAGHLKHKWIGIIGFILAL